MLLRSSRLEINENPLEQEIANQVVCKTETSDFEAFQISTRGLFSLHIPNMEAGQALSSAKILDVTCG